MPVAVRVHAVPGRVVAAPDRITVWADDEHSRFASVDELLAGAGPTAVYVCRPPGMLEAVRVARSNTPTRRFITSDSARRRLSTGSVRAESRGRAKVLRVPANRSALDVMLDWDPTTAYSASRASAGPAR